MAITSVGANASVQTMIQPEAMERRGANGREASPDNDPDDRVGGNGLTPTVNTQGQPLGALLNVKA